MLYDTLKKSLRIVDGGVVFYGDVADRLPYSIRILLESAIRNCDEFQVKSKDVEKIIDWENTSPKQVEIPFKPARVLLQVLTLFYSLRTQ